MKYIKIRPNDVVNGEGIMVSLWTQGCPHHCKGCFNTETWDFNKGKEFKEKQAYEILRLLDDKGVKRNLSILGGEPLCVQNIKGVLSLCKFIKELRPKTKIYVWTGYILEDLVKQYPLEKFSDIDVLIDGKFEETLKDLTLTMRGSKNQRVIDIKKTLKNNKIVNYF